MSLRVAVIGSGFAGLSAASFLAKKGFKVIVLDRPNPIGGTEFEGPILNKKYPQTSKITYWFPSLFIVGLSLSFLVLIFGFPQILYFYGFYFVLIFTDSLLQNKNLQVAFLSVFTSLTQFFGYGLGFLKSQF
jgi:hypothetical protein